MGSVPGKEHHLHVIRGFRDRASQNAALRVLPDAGVESTNPQGFPGVLWEKIARDEVWIGLRELARKAKRAIESGDASIIG